MTIAHTLRTLGAVALVAAVAACSGDQRAAIDSTAGEVGDAARAALSVIDVDMGRHVDADKHISDKTDEFAPTDTIYGSVHTSGTAKNSAVVGRWTSEDGTVLDEQTVNVATDGDAVIAFYISKPGGLAKGKYTLHVIIDGQEVRSKDVTVI